MDLSRRDFLSLAGLGAISATLPGAAGAVERYASNAGHATSRLKTSIAAYSFRQFLPEPGKTKNATMTLLDLCEMAASWGIDAVEPTSYYFESEDTAYLNALKVTAFNLGLDISGTAIRNNFCHPDAEQRRREIAHVKKWVDHAVQFGAPVIRIFAGNPSAEVSDEEAFALVVDGMKECCDYAGVQGVILAIENHGYLTTTAGDLLRILDAVNHEWLGINLDTGNFKAKPYEFIAAAAPYAANVQLKIEVPTRDGSGREPTDIPRVCGILRDAGYRGYIALEYEGRGDPHAEVPRYLGALQKAIDA